MHTIFLKMANSGILHNSISERNALAQSQAPHHTTVPTTDRYSTTNEEVEKSIIYSMNITKSTTNNENTSDSRPLRDYGIFIAHHFFFKFWFFGFFIRN